MHDCPRCGKPTEGAYCEGCMAIQQAEERHRQADKERHVRFYCEGCGEELWDLVDWEISYLRTYTLNYLRAPCLCSDCLLKEIREDREKEQDAA